MSDELLDELFDELPVHSGGGEHRPGVLQVSNIGQEIPERPSGRSAVVVTLTEAWDVETLAQLADEEGNTSLARQLRRAYRREYQLAMSLSLEDLRWLHCQFELVDSEPFRHPRINAPLVAWPWFRVIPTFRFLVLAMIAFIAISFDGATLTTLSWVVLIFAPSVVVSMRLARPLARPAWRWFGVWELTLLGIFLMGLWIIVRFYLDAPECDAVGEPCTPVVAKVGLVIYATVLAVASVPYVATTILELINGWHRQSKEYLEVSRDIIEEKRLAALSRWWIPPEFADRLGDRTFGTPGYSLIEAESKFGSDRIQKGEFGEAKTAVILDAVVNRYPEAKVFHSLPWPGSRSADVDHAIACGRGVVFIDSKNWRPGVYEMTTSGVLLRDGRPFEGGQLHLGAAVSAYASRLGPADLLGVVAVHCSASDREVVIAPGTKTPDGVSIVAADKLEELLSDQLEQWPGSLHQSIFGVLLQQMAGFSDGPSADAPVG